MNTTRANTAYDSRSNRAKRFEPESRPRPDVPDSLEVYALYVWPDDVDGFLLDVYADRAEAAADRALLADARTTVVLRAYRVETAERPSEAW